MKGNFDSGEIILMHTGNMFLSPDRATLFAFERPDSFISIRSVQGPCAYILHDFVNNYWDKTTSVLSKEKVVLLVNPHYKS